MKWFIWNWKGRKFSSRRDAAYFVDFMRTFRFPLLCHYFIYFSSFVYNTTDSDLPAVHIDWQDGRPLHLQQDLDCVQVNKKGSAREAGWLDANCKHKSRWIAYTACPINTCLFLNHVTETDHQRLDQGTSLSFFSILPPQISLRGPGV